DPHHVPRLRAPDRAAVGHGARPAHHAGRTLAAPPARRRVAAALERAPGRNEPGRPPTGAAGNRRAPGALPAALPRTAGAAAGPHGTGAGPAAARLGPEQRTAQAGPRSLLRAECELVVGPAHPAVHRVSPAGRSLLPVEPSLELAARRPGY